MPDIYATLARDVPGPVAGHVVLLGDATQTLTRVEALTANAGASVNDASLAAFARALTEPESDGHVWTVSRSWRVTDVVNAGNQVRAGLRRVERATPATVGMPGTG